jgi:FMN-dependent oxidoreductase (nitrilotriacetate monooxygenase family)
VDGFRTPAWNTTWSGSSDRDWPRDFYVDAARSLDRAKMDFVLFADTQNIKQAAGGNWNLPTQLGLPQLDPLCLAPILAWETKGLGIIPTASTTDWNPYLLARILASIDTITDGRVGWNMVTGGNAATAANLGYEPVGHDYRYEIADEFAQVVKRLWQSWEPDAVTRDYARDMYADGEKIHRIDFEGEHFRSRGPLTTPPSPQGQPVLAQAGASPAGREFASKYADVVIGSAATVEAMKEYNDDIRARMKQHGRDPSEVRIFFLVAPTLADTQAEAEERARLSAGPPEGDRDFAHGTISFSANWNMDLTSLNPDEPLPKDLTTEGHQAELQRAIDSGKTLREIVTGAHGHFMRLAGTPDAVASQLAEVQQETGHDGFMFLSLWPTRKYINEVTDGLVPVLQRRGLTRTEYESSHFRENLFAF